jgi:hypothetical protein
LKSLTDRIFRLVMNCYLLSAILEEKSVKNEVGSMPPRLLAIELWYGKAKK